MTLSSLQLGLVGGMWVEWLPGVLLQHLTPLSLVVLGYFVEKHYVSRPAVFANALAVNVHIRELVSPHQLLVLYANIGMVMAVLAIYTYITDESLRSEYYGVARGYGSLIVAGVIILS